ncbi:MAG: hypothetical protein NT005_00420 [Spirochaetes bacterium]|nr:hypothetical protein [Spirochaetota bacterium]
MPDRFRHVEKRIAFSLRRSLTMQACYIICDLILFAIPASHCKPLHVHLTDFFSPAIVAANRCVLLQALASPKNGFCQFEGLVPERVWKFKSSPQHRKTRNQSIVNNMPDHRLDAGRYVHPFQGHPRMSDREDTEDLVGEALPYRFHPREVQNDLPELIEPGEEPSGLRPGYILTGVEPYAHEASFEPEVEVLGRECAEHILKLSPCRAAYGQGYFRTSEIRADIHEGVFLPGVKNQLNPVGTKREEVARFGGEENPFSCVPFRHGRRLPLEKLSDRRLLLCEAVALRNRGKHAHPLIPYLSAKLSLRQGDDDRAVRHEGRRVKAVCPRAYRFRRPRQQLEL